MKNEAFTTLSNGAQMPLLGLGTWDMYGKEAEQATLDALEIGYRLIDTATLYRNEKEIGNALRKKRNTTKRNICNNKSSKYKTRI